VGALAHLPAFDHLLPVRFAMFVSLIVGVLVAQALAMRAPGTWGRWALAGVGIVALLPTFSGSYWSGKTIATPFFENGTYRRYLQRDEIVLAFPLNSGDIMQWQASSDWYFRMASGYISAEVPPDFWHDPAALSLLSPTGAARSPASSFPSSRATSSTATGSARRDRSVDGALLEGRPRRDAPAQGQGRRCRAVPGRATRALCGMGPGVPHRAGEPGPLVPMAGAPGGRGADRQPHELLPGRDAQRPHLEARAERSRQRRVPRRERRAAARRAGGATLNRRLTLAPGTRTLRLTVDGPRIVTPSYPNGLYLEVSDFRLTP